MYDYLCPSAIVCYTNNLDGFLSIKHKFPLLHPINVLHMYDEAHICIYHIVHWNDTGIWKHSPIEVKRNDLEASTTMVLTYPPMLISAALPGAPLNIKMPFYNYKPMIKYIGPNALYLTW